MLCNKSLPDAAGTVAKALDQFGTVTVADMSVMVECNGTEWSQSDLKDQAEALRRGASRQPESYDSSSDVDFNQEETWSAFGNNREPL